jgi:type I restriction enzyme R subunit
MNSNYSYVYVEFQERLDDLIRRKQEELDGIETILVQLGQLFTEVDDVMSLPKKMGFDDMGSFEIFTLIKNQKEGLKENQISDFAKACKNKIDGLIFTGWQDMPNKAKEITTALKLLSAAPEYEEMQLFEDENLFNQIQGILLKYYKVI